MRNVGNWRETKFVQADGRLRASREPGQVNVGSRLFADLTAEALGQAIPEFSAGLLLDLGCGQCPLFGIYRQHTDAVIAADWPASQHPLSHVDVACDLNAPLPFLSGAFDTVILTDVLEHVAEPGLLMAEIFRVLRPGGHLIGTVPFMYWLHEEPNDHYRYTEHALRRMAIRTGFAVLRLEPYGGAGDVIVDLAAKLSTNIHWRFGPRIADQIQRIWVRLRRGRLGRRSAEWWRAMPLAYLLVLQRPAGGQAARTGS